MTKFYIWTGAMAGPNGPVDLWKECTADGYTIDENKILHFHKKVERQIIEGAPPEIYTDTEYCSYQSWLAVYSDDAMPARLERPVMEPPRRQ